MRDLPVIAGYIEDTLDLSGNDATALIDIGDAMDLGVDVKGPAGTPTHVGTLVFDQVISPTDTPKLMPIPSVNFTAGNTVDEHVPIVGFTAAYLRVRYIFGSGGSGETCNIKVHAKRP